MQQNLPKTTKFCQNLLKELEELWNITKIEVLMFFKKQTPICRRGIKVCAHHLDFQYNNFLCAFFYCQKRTPFKCEFQHTPLKKIILFQCCTALVCMIFCSHVPNSLRNKNMKRHILNLFWKMVFGPPKLYLSPSGAGEKNYSINFECNDLTNNKKWMYKIWWICSHGS
jgi:hypothetical protein